jgi:imidazolonepropionase-like amidohydrolase
MISLFSLRSHVLAPSLSVVLSLAVAGGAVAGPLAAQLVAAPQASFSPDTRSYVAVGEPVIALVNATVIDGTGSPPKPGQTIVIRDGKIAEVGPAAKVTVPDGARSIDLTGQTVIPGIIGLHDHLYYTGAGGRAAELSFTGPRLYLAGGVTTLRTTGAMEPFADVNMKHAIDDGAIPGPHIFITAPYITGREPGKQSSGMMAVIETPEAARRFVDYWAAEGATWLKAYTTIRREELKAAIDEAHKRGLKVTGHLCSVSYREAVALGIDDLEHGLLTASDFDPQHTPDTCPANTMTRAGAADPHGDVSRDVIKTMIDHKVPMTSTLAVLEPLFPDRPVTDQRVLDAMSPDMRQSYLAMRAHIDSGAVAGTWPYTLPMLKNSMAFEKAFSDAGGLLAAGVDPTGIGGTLPGYGDQRNFELLAEAGFTPVQVVQIMSANGAKVLGIYDKVGSIEKGKVADLLVINGDLAADPANIRKLTTVFKDGVGYDSPKLIAAVQGHIGIN